MYKRQGLNLTSYRDGELSITADINDRSGNSAPQASTTTTKDTSAPSISITIDDGGDSILNEEEISSVSIYGTTTDLEDGQNVAIGVSSKSGGAPINANATVIGNSYSLTALDLSSFDDGVLSITADVDDLAGNSAIQASATTTTATAASAPVCTIASSKTRNGLRIIGSECNDQLIGKRGNDVLIGKAGDDRLHGKTGKDVIKAGKDDDILKGGRGPDRLHGGADNDKLGARGWHPHRWFRRRPLPPLQGRRHHQRLLRQRKRSTADQILHRHQRRNNGNDLPLPTPTTASAPHSSSQTLNFRNATRALLLALPRTPLSPVAQKRELRAHRQTAIKNGN